MIRIFILSMLLLCEIFASDVLETNKQCIVEYTDEVSRYCGTQIRSEKCTEIPNTSDYMLLGEKFLLYSDVMREQLDWKINQNEEMKRKEDKLYYMVKSNATNHAKKKSK